MKIRFAEDSYEEFQKIYEFMKKHNMPITERAKTILGLNDKGEIKALVSFRPVIQIVPLISENARIGKAVVDFMEKSVTPKLQEELILQCFTDEENEKLFNKYGFEKVFRDKINMEKTITKQKE